MTLKRGWTEFHYGLVKVLISLSLQQFYKYNRHSSINYKSVQSAIVIDKFGEQKSEESLCTCTKYNKYFFK